MKLQRVTKINQINEGPFDFIRGASSAAKQKIKDSNLGRNVGDIVNAGKQASEAGDIKKRQRQLAQYVQRLGQMMLDYNRFNNIPPDENVNSPTDRNPMKTNNQQTPAQQQTDNVQQTANQQTDQLNNKFAESVTFERFLQSTFNPTLTVKIDEGIWDFIKGASREGIKKVVDRYQNKPSVLKDLYHAGAAASRQGDARSLEGNINKVTNIIVTLYKQLGPVGQTTLSSAINDLPPEIRRSVKKVIGKAMQGKV